MILNVGAPGSSGSICTAAVRSVQSVHGVDYLTKERVVSKLSSPSQEWCQQCTPVSGEAPVRNSRGRQLKVSRAREMRRYPGNLSLRVQAA